MTHYWHSVFLHPQAHARSAATVLKLLFPVLEAIRRASP